VQRVAHMGELINWYKFQSKSWREGISW